MAQEWEDNYDPNTEVEVKGKIVDIAVRERGPVILGIERNNKIYYILTAPRWYIEQEKIELKNGDEVLIHGAKFFTKRGEMFLIARSIQNLTTGKLYSFRDKSLKPSWKERGKGKWNRGMIN